MDGPHVQILGGELGPGAAGGHHQTGGLTRHLHLAAAAAGAGIDHHKAISVCKLHLVGAGDVTFDGLIQQGHGGGPVNGAQRGQPGAVLHSAEDAHLGQHRQIARRPICRLGPVGKPAQVGVAVRPYPHGPGKHDHGLLPGDGLGGVAVFPVPFQDSGGGTLQDGVGVPLVPLQVGVPVLRLLSQAQQPDKNGSQLSPGQIGGRPEQPLVVPLHQAGLQPAVDGICRPALGHIGQLILPGGGQSGSAHRQPHGQGQQQGQWFFCLHG